MKLEGSLKTESGAHELCIWCFKNSVVFFNMIKDGRRNIEIFVVVLFFFPN